MYNQYSKTIPYIGKLIVGSEKPYKYLIESIKKFYNQEELAKLMKIKVLKILSIGIYLMVIHQFTQVGKL